MASTVEVSPFRVGSDFTGLWTAFSPLQYETLGFVMTGINFHRIVSGIPAEATCFDDGFTPLRERMLNLKGTGIKQEEMTEDSFQPFVASSSAVLGRNPHNDLEMEGTDTMRLSLRAGNTHVSTNFHKNGDKLLVSVKIRRESEVSLEQACQFTLEGFMADSQPAYLIKFQHTSENEPIVSKFSPTGFRPHQLFQYFRDIKASDLLIGVVFPRVSEIAVLLHSILSPQGVDFPVTPDNEDIARIWFEKSSMQLKERVLRTEGKAILNYACKHGQISVATVVLEKWGERALNGISALHNAMYYGHLDVARLLIAHGADTRALNKYGETPFQIAGKLQSRKGITIPEDLLDLLRP